MASASEALFQPFPMQAGRRAQVWRHQPSFRRPRHFHAEPEINLVAAGVATLGVGGEPRVLRAGQACVFFPGQDHELLEASQDLQLYVLALTPELWERAVEPRFRRVRGNAELSLAERSQAVELFGALPQVSDRTLVERSLGDFFGRVSATPPPRAEHTVARRAVELVREAPWLSGKELARRLRVDPAEVSRHVHRELGIRLVDYRSRLRLLALVREVKAGRSLSRAAAAAGFGSYAQCHRVCTQAFGCSPQRFFAQSLAV